MTLTPEQLALITAFRKETEDLVQANVRNIFKVKYGEKTLSVGSNTITFQIGTDDSYLNGTEYEVKFFEATDSDGIDIKEAISITTQTASAFTINTPRAGVLRWQTNLKTPSFNFWTNS